MSSEYVDENGVFYQNWGLVEGRHEIPNIDGYIFGTIEDVLDFDNLEKQAHIWSSELFNWITADGDMNVLSDDIPEDWGINLYVTGLTSALIALLGSYWWWDVTGITFWHFDRDTGEYVPQTWKY